ncbi:MAG TPA: LLM class flavin-dependent oxidoreductase [Thermomicrobiales bacterium]|nr:LLM class flavin-dependent oxidoreductase [Thermomicrobiales bacterium]
MATHPNRPLKVGAFIPIVETEMDGDSPRGADVLAMARMAEAVGFDSVWIPDHLVIYDPGQEPKGAWEMGSMLGALAVATERVEIGALVAATSFRNPGLLAKMATTIDELSGGRLILGLGTGRHEPEHRAFGYPFDRQVSRFEDALQVIVPLLREGSVDYAGPFYQARDCALRPRGPRPSGPPLLIGSLGAGPRMLDLVARYADYWNAWLTWDRSWPDAIPPLRANVDAACRAAGRDPATLGRTVAIMAGVSGMTARLASTAPIGGGDPLRGTPEEMAAALRGFAAEGIDHIQVICAPNTVAGIAGFATVLAALDRT